MDGNELEIALGAYESAQSTAHHSDQVIWEIVAIIWGSNTLLLGFIFEAVDSRAAQPLIIFTSVLGILLTVFVQRVWSLAKIGQKIAFGICREIEGQFPPAFQLHRQITAVYPPESAKWWVQLITFAFVVVWAIVFFRVLWLYFCAGAVSR